MRSSPFRRLQSLAANLGRVLPLGLAPVLAIACGGQTRAGAAPNDGGVDDAAQSAGAAFAYSPSVVVQGQAVAFTDTSSGSPTAWSWDFGDGKGTSRLQSPKYVYDSAGTFTVTLTTTTPAGSDSARRSVTVSAAADALAAGFTYSSSGATVAFTDTSTGHPATWAWDFGDGATSSAQSPTHAYAAGKYYSAKLTVTSDAGASTFSQTVIVSAGVPRTVGLMKNTSRAFQGYTLFAPKQNRATYLIDNDGRIVHQWTHSTYPPGQTVYLLENGNLLHTGLIQNGGPNLGGGEGGRVEEWTWDDTMIWSVDWYSSTYIQHHDVRRLPNGNILMLVAETKTYADVVAAGFDPNDPKFQDRNFTSGTWGFYPDSVVEITPDYASKTGGKVVWEWHVWDHLVQSRDPTKDNYAAAGAAAHPELLETIGGPAFWNHMNSVAYNADFDQIALSLRNQSEVWIIDHGTTTAEAASHAGGKRGKGGDILYRWGNPANYHAASTASPERYWQQHDLEWIDADCPGAGHLTDFDNDLGRWGSTNASSVEEFAPAVDVNGNYAPIAAGAAFGPANYTWSYQGDAQNPLYSPDMGGAQRLPNGDTLITSAGSGELVEVSYLGEIVWRYVNPIQATGPVDQGAPPATDPVHTDETLNSVFRAYRYAPTHPGLSGKTLTPGNYVVQ